ncbi:hypothetical protein [Lihuaxuella thermophila]|uniref:Uncharacterized protein n=1 Tax=Lihuaxuella thermophila TaxID=1173111 RepID=A0A1H8BQM0_9BACL|nr:hypothetical protein [Lihuaxuella thermophila]SEM84318.1 hypothetical protein SAMN05444955_102277 [Lihuaxuella thermophila]
MIKLQVEGQPNKVQPFLHDLKQRPQIELIHQEVKNKGMTGQIDVSVTCYVRHRPDRRLRMVQMVTAEGAIINLPMLDLIVVEIEEGVRVFCGKVYDVFG